MKRDDELFARYSTATWWTNLPEDADTVIQLYHDHATSRPRGHLPVAVG